jgi:DNA-binding beta-propeller fold protein YncE
MKRLILPVVLGLLTASVALVQTAAAAPPWYEPQGTVNVAPSIPKLTAVDPMAWGMFGNVLPARPFLYSVDANGITITRFNDNKVVGTWSWPKPPEVIYTVLPNGSFTGLTPPTVWEPVGMAVSYPTEMEIANRLKEIPDLTPPWTFVYVVMAHSGYRWNSNGGSLRDSIVQNPDPDTDSSMLIQINVSDPSFSTWNDPVAPTAPHIAGAILGHGAGQPVYDRKTGNVYVGNMPSHSLPPGLKEFVSVIRRIPPTVTAEEAEIPGLSKPVIRCGPQHPETGIPLGRPQAYACYDPSGVHPLDDNEHVGAAGGFEWEFRNLPAWLKVHNGVLGEDGITRGSDGVLYGTPPATGAFWAEARVHNLDDPYGVFSDWHPVQLTVNPTAEYLPIKAQFAAGVPVAYPLEGTGSCALSNPPAWVEAVAVPNGCIVMGTAPLDGEYYNFTMPGFTPAGYSGNLTFSGNVFGAYGFVPLPTNVGISGMAWHQVSKVADPSTETPVLSLEYIGVDPTTGQLWRILPPPGQPQPPNVRPPETALTLDVVSAEGAPLPGSGFGEVAVEADRNIYVAAGGSVIKVSGGMATPISLPEGMHASCLSLDSDLRTAIPGVEPGQSDHGALWVAGSGKAAVIDTDARTVAQWFAVTGASSVSVDYRAQYAYVATGSNSIAVFGPTGTNRPAMAPRIWSSEEITWNLGFATLASGPFQIMATGDPVPTLSLLGTLPKGINFRDNADGTATIGGIAEVGGGGGNCGSDAGGEGDPEGGDPCGDYAFTVIATNSQGIYAQALGMSVNVRPTIDSPNTATFYAGAASSFTIFGTGYPTPIFYTWDEGVLAAAGVQLVDNENGTASLIGTPTTPGKHVFTLKATTGCPVYPGPYYSDTLDPDATQQFTLNVNISPAGGAAPAITSGNTATWAAVGAPFSPDPFTVTSIGSPTPKLSVVTAEGQTGLPPGVNFIDNGNGAGALGAACRIVWQGMEPECLGLLAEGTQGTYTFTIRASNMAGTTDQAFTLILEHNTSLLGATPATLSFPGAGTSVYAQTVTLTTLGDTMPYALVTTASWLTATPEYGTIRGTTGSPITVSANSTGLAPGTYTGTVIIGSAGTEGPFATVAVTLTVIGLSDPYMMGVWPSTMRFEYQVVSGTPPPQTLFVLSGGAGLSYTVSTGGAKWLSATPASGTAPGSVSVSVDPRVGVGMHIGNLTIAPNCPTCAVNDPLIVPVTLVKIAGDSDLVRVMFDVGGGPEGLAANLKTHNLFITSSSGGAEAAESGAESGPEVETPGPPEPSLVFHVNPVDKTVVGEIVVHSEGEYIGVNSTTGMAYHASQGTGEVAAINGFTNKVVAFIPLTLNGEVYQPYQVAIDEAQNLIYVGAKSPEPEPNALIPDATGKYGCKAIRELPSDEAPAGQEELDCWHAGAVFVIDGNTNTIVGSFLAGDDPEGVVFAKATGKVYVSNEDDGTITVAKGAKRNANGTITAPSVIGTIISGKLVSGQWQPTCDYNNYCGQRGKGTNLPLWPEPSACHGIDDEAEEADKMAVDPAGNVYIIDDRYRVAKIDGKTDQVVKVLAIPGYDCERSVPDGSEVVLRNTANNISYMALGQGKLYVVSEQNTVTLIDPKTMTIKATLTIPGAVELDAITTDPALNRVYITDESLAALWILKGACANGVGVKCVLE